MPSFLIVSIRQVREQKTDGFSLRKIVLRQA